MDGEWIAAHGAAITDRAEAELRALVDISSPSGDVAAAEACFAACAQLLPEGATVERAPCSSLGHADDFIARVTGTGTKRLLLVGHVDTVVAHADHRRLEHDEDRLTGSGSIDMKGGDVLALGVLRALAERPDLYAQVALLLVCDEEWRTADFGHTERFAGFDACLCFEAGERSADRAEAVVVRRKGAGTLRVDAVGRAAHSGSAPDRGRNALLALAAAAQAVAACHDPHGPHRLTAVPTILRSGDAFNVVPGAGELWCDLRSDDLAAFKAVLDAVPRDVAGVSLTPTMVRHWPGMDAEQVALPVLSEASRLLGRAVAPARRGGASDAAHFAAAIPLTIDGLGPRGGAAHHPDEWVSIASLRPRAEVALAVTLAALRS